MVRLISSIFFLLLCLIVNAQQYIGRAGTISFFSEAPLENISAVNNKVGAVYDARTEQIVFQLYIKDFIFPKALMQDHFNENYMESDIFPKSTFVGKIVERKDNMATVEGQLTVHGETNKITVDGRFQINDEIAQVSDVRFILKLEDYKIKVPKIVMYNIAEEIEVKVNIKMKRK